MSILLTYWEDPKNKKDPDDYDAITWIQLKSVKQIPELIAAAPENCTMISTEYTGDHKRNGKITNPQNPRWFKEVWIKGQSKDPKPKVCPLCGNKI